MIRTDHEYREALRRIEEDQRVIREQERRLQEVGLTGDELERALQPALAFHAQLTEEVETYERIKRGEFDPLYDLTHIGRLLIGARIALNLSQRELAERMGISESVVSRDERNEYHGISIDRAQRVLEALGIKVRVEVEEPVVTAA